MNCFRPKGSKTPQAPTKEENPESRNVKHEVLLTVPGCKVHLMEEGEALELANGCFTVLRLSDENVELATIINVGEDLQWPLTKDEPVVKLDALHYLFSLPIGDGEALSYGVEFHEEGGGLGLLDSFLRENSCFSCSSSSGQSKDLNWKEFAPAVEDYNNFLAKAIAGGTGKIVKGIFKCSNAYTNQVQKGGEVILTQAVEHKSSIPARERKSNKDVGSTKKSGANKSLKRVRKLSRMTQKMSKKMLDGVGIATGSVMAPVVRSQAGKAFLAMVPGEILLASLDAVNKVMDAAEAAEKQAFSATSAAATRMVSQRFGESAGEATQDALATAGHCAGTAWNIFKIRKAINPASSVSSGVLKNARSYRKP
ncbi:senescence/dehydration-associated protein At4g35985, chloroplastic-like isoform X3 [Diospyros lotus]|uniref:senescence/dehydration-associated protein At4g35985, chloroplastic-like isoform X3 n=1 Tax=Diospyros lotus TaxID=55363 RepID=UPI00225153C3|nr:senescence/dehydration-associated protein At4g35985, chloroplastic-like isoform X3 [Diospyros lotus]